MKKLLTATAIIAMSASTAMAEMHGDMNIDKKAEMKAEKYLNKMDTNNDGVISQVESRSYADKMFMDADKNKDNQVTKAELTEYKKMKMKDKNYKKDQY